MLLKLKYILFLSLLFFVIAISSHCQDIDQFSSFPVLNVENEEFVSLIDSVITFEKNCDYYSDELFFYVHLQELPDKYLVQIGSVHEFEDLANINGAFEYEKHLFLVTGKQVHSWLLSSTKQSLKINRGKDNPEINTNEAIPMEDDSNTFWVYTYENGKFRFQELHTFCNNQ